MTGIHPPIRTIHLFPVLDRHFIELLRSLTPDEWNKPTLARLWTVKDIATHLLDGNLRTLSMARDGYFGEQPDNIHSYHDLVAYLNQLNAEWVKATRRLSPTVLIELLELTGRQYSDYLTTLDPFGPAIFSVAWAGEQESRNWFHIAREYTEKWHHQQQIRHAVGKPGIMTKALFFPCIDTFMVGLPYTYRNIQADPGTVIRLTITTKVGGDWYLTKTDEGWHLSKNCLGKPVTEIFLDPDTAWKLFTKGMSPEAARQTVEISGNQALGNTALTMVSVMA
jgi:uncharacterized protein (TIGR03083 family)